MNLRDYLQRIGYTGKPAADLPTLRALQRAHLYHVPFEALDVQLQRGVGLDVEASYDKVVRQRRGGWCYELNGVFGWALGEIGFDVTRMSGAVMREQRGDSQWHNHLCLRVGLDQDYLVDVGFGGSLLEPLPLRAIERLDAPFNLSLSSIGDDCWRFSEAAPHSAPFTFDFRSTRADETLLDAKCRELQTDPASSFVQNLVVQQRCGDTHVSLRGRVLTITHPNRQESSLLNSAEELVKSLRERFDLNLPETAALWPAICARHEVVFAQQQQQQ